MNRWIALALALLSFEAKAIMLMGSADPERNTAPPAGVLANSGWELQGEWNEFQGTPIGPRHFITAAHIGGAVGNVFVFRGVEYLAVAISRDAETDLAIWEVRGTLPQFARLYDGPDETGRGLVVVGRGAIRGSPVSVGFNLRGWQWGNWDQRLRWGTNVVYALTRDAGQGATDAPRFIEARFDDAAGDDEGHLGVGDSGGGIFISQGGEWRLAAINYAVEGPYNTSATGPGFNGAFFDEGGLYKGGEGNWSLIFDLPTAQPGSFFATRIKPRLAWISSVLAQPSTPSVVGAARVQDRFMSEPSAMVDAAARTVRVPLGAGARFLALESSVARTLRNPRIEGGFLVFQYE